LRELGGFRPSILEGRVLLEAGYLTFTFLLLLVSLVTQPKRLKGLLVICALWMLTLTLQLFHSTYTFGTAVAIGFVLEVAVIAL